MMDADELSAEIFMRLVIAEKDALISGYLSRMNSEANVYKQRLQNLKGFAHEVAQKFMQGKEVKK